LIQVWNRWEEGSADEGARRRRRLKPLASKSV
jgi:hypothetical protein